jgi:hypothetical protein
VRVGAQRERRVRVTQLVGDPPDVLAGPQDEATRLDDDWHFEQSAGDDDPEPLNKVPMPRGPPCAEGPSATQ